MNIEYAGGHTLAAVNESRAAAIARAPAWWRQMARETYKRAADAQASAPGRQPARPNAMPTARQVAARRWEGWGWVAGMCAPGVSTPVYSQRDREQLPEQFTPECWEQILRDINSGKRPVTLTLGHHGQVLASTAEHLKFRLHTLFGMGLQFSAKLPERAVTPELARALTTNGIGVSVGYVLPKGWITERSGVGRVRVINEAVLDHVALVVPGAGSKAAYAGARCYGSAGERFACPRATVDKAELYAYRLIKQQAGARP